MLNVIKGLLQVMKNNTSLRYAIITGCLRVVKESIFTGTNNFVSDTITDTRLNEYFGFTQQNVDNLLQAAKLTEHAEEIKTWYNGYTFGEFDILPVGCDESRKHIAVRFACGSKRVLEKYK